MNIATFFKYKQNTSIDEMTNKADIFMLFLFWFHLPFTGFFASYSYGNWKEGLFSGLILAIIGTISFIFSRGTFAHRLLNGLLLLSFSIILITIQYGRIEMHFHIFAVLPFLILYKDWRIIPPAALLIALHHAAFNYCQANDLTILGFPLIVFNYGSGWDIVVLHAFFVIFEACVLIYYSSLFKSQHAQITLVNKNLESIVDERTINLKNEKDKIENYKKTLDQIALTTTFDLDGIIMSVNYNQTEITGYEKTDLIGRPLEFLYQNNKELFKDIWSTLRSGHTWKGEIKELSKKGDAYWVDTVISPVWDSELNIKSYMEIKFDITEKVHNREVVLKQQAQIVSQSKLSSLGEMAGGIAHEINNPLAIISFSIKALRIMISKGMEKTADFIEALDDIDSTVIRITKIIDGLRNVSRDSSEEFFDDVQIKDILNDTLALCSEKFKSHGVELEVINFEEYQHVQVQVLRVQLSQVLINLLTNAYDEINQYDEKWIKIFLEIKDEFLIIKVMDSGKGIPQEVADKIFQPFFTTKDIGKGTGLGMSLSHSIIKKHKGEIFIDSTSENTCFVIKVPVSHGQ